MRNILGHKSWSKDEIVEILCNHGTFTMCNLPHYRYDSVKDSCRDLKKHGFIRKAGSTSTGVSFVVTDIFLQWRQEKENNLTMLGPVKWRKKQYVGDLI